MHNNTKNKNKLLMKQFYPTNNTANEKQQMTKV